MSERVHVFVEWTSEVDLAAFLPTDVARRARARRNIVSRTSKGAQKKSSGKERTEGNCGKMHKTHVCFLCVQFSATNTRNLPIHKVWFMIKPIIGLGSYVEQSTKREALCSVCMCVHVCVCVCVCVCVWRQTEGKPRAAPLPPLPCLSRPLAGSPPCLPPRGQTCAVQCGTRSQHRRVATCSHTSPPCTA